MKKILLEFLILIGIGGLIWAAIAFFIKLPERPVLLSIEKEQTIGENYRNMILTLTGFSAIENEYIDSVLVLTALNLEESNEESRYEYKITLVDNTMVNAFALPGGYIIVTTGLVEFCDSSEELLAVIAHEIGHIEKRHVVTRLVKDIGLDLLTSNDPYVTGEIAKTIVSSGYNRRQEEAADLFACELMLMNNFEPRVLAHLFRKLKEEGKGDSYGQFEIISSHPNLDARIRSILSFKVPEDFTPVEPWIDWSMFQSEVENLISKE
jgi:beta-barrel assembly-enhancing protease